MAKCAICGEKISLPHHRHVLCKYHGWLVHLECCKKKCSWDGKPCKHAYKIY